jgi:hypothetical protein
MLLDEYAHAEVLEKKPEKIVEVAKEKAKSGYDWPELEEPEELPEFGEMNGGVFYDFLYKKCV